MKESAEHAGASTSTASIQAGKRTYYRKQSNPFQKSRSNHVDGSRKRQDPHNGLIVHSSHQHQRDPSTLANFCQAMLRVSALHILQSAGYDAVQVNPMAVLVDCLGRYLEFLAESAKEFAEHSGRSQITAFDVVDGLSDLGIELPDLKEWLMENGGESIVSGKSTASQSTDGATGSDTLATSGTGASAGQNAPNRPVLPSWKGADPGRLINDLLWNGRKTDTARRDTYEWHTVPEWFIMPDTEEEQDAFAYPEASDDDDAKEQVSASKSDSKESRIRHPRWIPELKPSHIPDYIPPFPGSAIVEDDLDEEEEASSSVFKPSQSSEEFDGSMSALAAPASELESKAREQGIVDDISAQPGLAKLSINTSQPAPSTATVEGVENTANAAKRTDANPYTHVVPFLESSLPFSTLYTAIPPKSTSKSSAGPVISKPSRPTPTGLSPNAQQLFSDTLLTLMDPAPTSNRRAKRRSKLVNVTARPGELSDTLFSNTQQSGVIDSLLKQSAPSSITNKFANPGVSVQDALSPPLPSERVMNGVYSDYHSVPEQVSTGGRASTIPGGSRKSSFSNSPLSTVTFPPKESLVVSSVSSGQVSGLAAKPKAGSRKSSLVGADSTAPGSTLSSAPASVISLAPVAIPVIARSGSTVSAAPINPSILSRIGSNFDPATLLAAQGSNTTGSNQVPITNGVSASTPAQPSPVPVLSTAPVSSGIKNLTANYLASNPPASTLAKSAPSTITASATAKAPVGQMRAVPKPIPGPISLSGLPLSISSPSMGASTARTPSTAAAVTPTTPSVPTAPKIRFKFSAISSSGGDHDSSSSASKRDHSSGSHSYSHHRSSSTTSTGSSHKKSKKSSREYDYDDDDEDGDGLAREKKKKKKSKSKDKDRDREYDCERSKDRDSDGSSRHKHHKYHKHHRDDHSSTNGTYSSSKSSSRAGGGYGYSTYQTVPVEEDSTEVINCICSQPTLDDGLFMIACDSCQEWFHGRCVGIREGDVVGTWYCRRCTASGRARV
ncbi:hypothetical protein BC939DRAFT_500216 [Gamsiella multidivaricata]|uniref:uncharacterized protein n=1 Tax=Gamsiella multidivaricata TaxID=101098 RepID=UPI00221FE9D9|nr:uncharacterized protein BC939DRAFT_500216 [Gamsiella multidivaricata]KAG0369729.1 hypothetical protein BGZ54_009076 [Gamsiella multidivaricata]KAI7829366.1 hypothetical protein BC939DRAFT_500216 [Gamsiella multidivaricata]